MLRTKSIKAEVVPDDGYRISIMSRHTLDDGLTPDPEIKSEMYNAHYMSLAPRPNLIGRYVRKEIGWDQYADEFNEYLHSDFAQSALRQISWRAMGSNVTLMCVEDTPERCHRRLVVEACQLIIPELVVDIR